MLADCHAFVVTAEGDQAAVYTGVWGGDVVVAGELLWSAPDEPAGWEAVVEFSARVSTERPLRAAFRLEGPAGGPIATESIGQRQSVRPVSPLTTVTG